MKEPIPNDAELVSAVDDLFYSAHQSAIFAYWCLIKQPVHVKFDELGIPDAKQYFHNGLLEGALMFIRKTIEFFKSQAPNDRSDTLYAYRYLPEWDADQLVSESIYIELHKRVGHITVREARYGKMQWPIFDLTISSIRQWISFFEQLPNSPVFKGACPSSQIEDRIAALREILAGCDKLAKENNKRPL